MNTIPKTVTELNRTEVKEIRRMLNFALPTQADLKSGANYDQIGKAMQYGTKSNSKPIRRAGRRVWTVLKNYSNDNAIILGCREMSDGTIILKEIRNDGSIHEIKV